MNKALAGVIRATSAFPAAFEPRRIVKTRRPEKALRGGRAGRRVVLGRRHPSQPAVHRDAVDDLHARRGAARPRWLLSVEPDPEAHQGAARQVYPEVPEVVGKALMGIPRYQSIAGDLADLAAARGAASARRGAFLRRVDEVTAGVDAQVSATTRASRSFSTPSSSTRPTSRCGRSRWPRRCATRSSQRSPSSCRGSPRASPRAPPRSSRGSRRMPSRRSTPPTSCGASTTSSSGAGRAPGPRGGMR